MKRVVLITDAPLGHDWQRKGSEFTVVDKRPDALGLGEVDQRTADAWERMDWAAPVGAKKAAKSAD